MTGLFMAATLSVAFTANAARPSFTSLPQQVNQLQAENNAQEEDINALKTQVNENTLDLEGITLNTADLEPPQILIDAPATTVGGNELVTTTFSDNQGLFKYRAPPRDEESVSYESEKAIVVERSVVPRFGQDTLLTAYATDRSGNAATATRVIQSVTGITPGLYVLDEPLNEPLSGSGCGLTNQDYSLEADTVEVTGSFLQPYETCESFSGNEDPENTVACIRIFVNNVSYSPLPGTAVGAITSIEDTVFSADSFTGGGGTSRSYTQMNAEFYDTIPATVSIDMTLRCESTLYGTTTFGPYQMHGTLQQ